MGSGRAGCWKCPAARPIDQSQRSAYKTSGREKISSVTLTYPFGRSGKVAGPSVVVVARRREERDWVIYLCRTFFVSRSSLVSSSYLLLLSGPRASSRIRETRNCEIVLFCFFAQLFLMGKKPKKRRRRHYRFCLCCCSSDHNGLVGTHRHGDFLLRN